MKEVLKGKGAQIDSSKVLSRSIPSAVIDQYVSRIASLEDQIKIVLQEERLQARVSDAEREVERAQNMIIFKDEIESRPPRTWYQTETEKRLTQEMTTKMIQQDQSVSNNNSSLEVPKKGKKKLNEEEQVAEKDPREHRLSRKKRRRQEALEEMRRENGNDIFALIFFFIISFACKSLDMLDTRPLSIDRAPKPSKASLRAGEEALKEKMLTSNSKGKAFRPKFAVGGIDPDIISWGEGKTSSLSKKESKKLRMEKEFTDFDPNKRLKKGGKSGTSSFKSKAKYKRRK
jgi:ATP-dependent RNA helicase DDX27